MRALPKTPWQSDCNTVRDADGTGLAFELDVNLRGDQLDAVKRLIAAAPELLEALKGEATEIDGRLCWCTQPNMIKYRGHDGGCESNRELVAKATGEGA